MWWRRSSVISWPSGGFGENNRLSIYPFNNTMHEWNTQVHTISLLLTRCFDAGRCFAAVAVMHIFNYGWSSWSLYGRYQIRCIFCWVGRNGHQTNQGTVESAKKMILPLVIILSIYTIHTRHKYNLHSYTLAWGCQLTNCDCALYEMANENWWSNDSTVSVYWR